MVRDLREAVLRQHRNAGRKVARLDKQGAGIAGTEFDPRRDVLKVSRYTRKQLLAYQRELSEFSRRGGGFVPMGDGKVTVHEWDRFKAAEREVNRIRSDIFNRVKDVQVEGLDQTFGRVIGIEPTKVRDADSTNNPFRQTNVRADSFPGVDEFRNRQADMFDNTDIENYVGKFNAGMRESLTKMFDSIAGAFGDSALMGMDDMISEMSDLGFMMLAGRKSFMNKAADVYEVATRLLKSDGRSMKEEMDDRTLEMNDETSENLNSMMETVERVSDANQSLKNKLNRLRKKYTKKGGGLLGKIANIFRRKGL